ncbi:hypothetical protein [Stenotrophobium rhamnosiphilum]|uniref:Ketosynthase n=1 Tax=Stenotrophobium rhamnosiphilum TaxID=2029166 RepID=A0A2T5MFN6_9GAMM|nr:hypothetical protein [Stenotrophobium rhamnosiphilum]PTU31393.1 hypothetical protein CJD38_08605 [Stenotrophobium rhamnosiphilum]
MPVLVLAYPVLVHLAIMLHRIELQWLALCCLAAIPLYAGLRALRPQSWLLLLVAMALLWGLTHIGGSHYILMLPPVLLPALGAWFFGRTLLAGQSPLITRMALVERGGVLPQELYSYTRNITWLWTLLLAGMSLLNAALAIWATPELWSWCTNFLNYVIMVPVFGLEYLYRRLRYRHLPHPGVIGFIRNIATTNYRSL